MPQTKRTEISELGEFGLIDHLTKDLKPQNVSTLYSIGDDCAVLDYSGKDKEVLITTDMLMEFRQFLYDEYKYVPLYPDLYPRGSGHHWPKKRLRDTTVVHDLKLLHAFFAELAQSMATRKQ